MDKLIKIQSELKAPKDLTNKFGGYKYRSCEKILEAVKPLLKKHGCLMTLTDDVVERNGQNYVKATARFMDGDFVVESSALARDGLEKKGMDASQVTGSASSYARKYALNGLFLIDDSAIEETPDPDSLPPEEPKPPKKEERPAQKYATAEQLGKLTEVCKTYKLDKQLVASQAGITNSRVTIEAYNKAMSIANSMIAEKEAKGEA